MRISGRTRADETRDGRAHLGFAAGVVHGGRAGAAQKLLLRHQQRPRPVIPPYRLLILVNAELAQLFGADTLQRALGLDRSLRSLARWRSPESTDLLIAVLATRD